MNSNDLYRYIFSTEGHLLPATSQISLVREHCSYFGSYCESRDSRHGSHLSDISHNAEESNGTRLYRGPKHKKFYAKTSIYNPPPVSGLIKVSEQLLSRFSVFLYLAIRHTLCSVCHLISGLVLSFCQELVFAFGLSSYIDLDVVFLPALIHI